ncbi:MAG: hypothetical protein D4R82_00835 [Dehalococcoidia bacterium]|nr:MAG: hypothetical protein D4R82_00835 [Dehalococcoidia bacterium]
MAELNGLYYPGESWDLSLEDSLLKKCLLFFDKIYAIVPEVFSVDWQDVQPYDELDPFLGRLRSDKVQRVIEASESLTAGQVKPTSEENEASQNEIDRYFRITKFMGKIESLRREGIVDLVDPRENLLDPPYWVASPKPYYLYDAYPWMHISKDYLSIVGKKAEVDRLEDYKPHMLYGSILGDLKNVQFRNLAGKLGENRVILFKGQAEQNWIHQLGKASGFSEDEWQHFPSAVHYFGFPGTVSTVMWAALVVNHTLMTAHRYNLIPITPNVVFNELLQSKLQHLSTIQIGKESEKIYFNHPQYKSGFSGLSLMICSLPNLELMSFDDVMELRLALKDELAACRDEIFTLSELIKASPWDPAFQNQVECVIEHKIEPVAHNLQRKLRSSQQQAVLRALPIGSASTVLSLLASIWAGMPPILVIAVAAGLISLEAALEYYWQRKKIYQSNGLSLLLRFQQNN